ncbi:hypothetical protein B0H19DRAFT_1146434 [Mycena capillaripes]|nr:hypothetical protein B0H19DRAFT_1146434 [Mycena capillaripes]
MRYTRTLTPPPCCTERSNRAHAISSNDPETTSVSSETSSQGSPISSATGPFQTEKSSPAISERRVSVGAIAGGTVCGFAVVLGVLTKLLCCRRRSRSKPGTASPSIEEAPLPPLGGVVTAKESTEGRENGWHGALFYGAVASRDSADVAAALAAQVRALEAEVQRLKSMTQREESNTAGSDTIPSRSLSTMKRAQTRAVRDHQDGYTGADALVHTDSGLRLKADRVVNELHEK